VRLHVQVNADANVDINGSDNDNDNDSSSGNCNVKQNVGTPACMHNRRVPVLTIDSRDYDLTQLAQSLCIQFQYASLSPKMHSSSSSSSSSSWSATNSDMSTASATTSAPMPIILIVAPHTVLNDGTTLPPCTVAGKQDVTNKLAEAEDTKVNANADNVQTTQSPQVPQPQPQPQPLQMRLKLVRIHSTYPHWSFEDLHLPSLVSQLITQLPSVSQLPLNIYSNILSCFESFPAYLLSLLDSLLDPVDAFTQMHQLLWSLLSLARSIVELPVNKATDLQHLTKLLAGSLDVWVVQPAF
jgi:hypothetical protein